MKGFWYKLSSLLFLGAATSCTTESTLHSDGKQKDRVSSEQSYEGHLSR